MTALLMLSGGIDSTVCLHEALKAGRPLHVHHISFRSHEGRQPFEDRAVANILDWHRARGMDDFKYTESKWDYGTLRWIPKDVNVWGFVAAVVLADPKNKHITSMIVPRHLDAFGHVVDPAGSAAKSNRLINGFASLVAGRKVQLEFPIGELTKAEVIARLPEDLLNLCWWCRKPKNGRPCHQCMTCKQVDAARKQLM